jgi:hypothetical protein
LDNLETVHLSASVASTTTSKANVNIRHHCLGHISAERVIQMVRKGAVAGTSFIPSDLDTTPCGPCQLGKHRRTPITKEPHVIQQSLSQIALDVPPGDTVTQKM